MLLAQVGDTSAYARLNDPKYLQAYYPLAGDARDYSGWERHGTWSGTEAYQLGPNGKDVSYGYSSVNYITILSNSIPINQEYYTTSAWVYRVSGGSTYQNIFTTMPQNSPYYGLNMALRTSDGAIVSTINSTDYISTKHYIPLNKWTFVVIRRALNASGYIQTSVNGSLFDTLASGNFAGMGIVTNAPCLIGKWQFSYFRGKISNVRIYNIALTASEVAALYDIDQRASFYVPQPESDPSVQLSIWNTVKDWSQQNRTLTKFNVVEGGNGIRFNGSNSYLSTADFIGTNDFTMSCWFRANGYGEGNLGRLFTNGRNEAYLAETKAVILTVASNTTSGNIGYVFPQWNCITIIRSGNLVTFYKNGLQVGTPNQDAGTKSAGTVLTIGNSATIRTFDGLLNGFRIWNRVLTAAEIKNLYQNEVIYFK